MHSLPGGILSGENAFAGRQFHEKPGIAGPGKKENVLKIDFHPKKPYI